MKQLLLLLIIGSMAVSLAFSQEKEGNETQINSTVTSPINPLGSTFPLPFTSAGNNPRTQPAVSTGYYFIDNTTAGLATTALKAKDNFCDWRFDPNFRIVDTTYQPNLWTRILSGPNQRLTSFWDSHDQGRRYFRNPLNMNDSTDDAIAGPIPIGFPFYFNGIRYDSFYVSTNGIISLSNRRYFYNTNGQKFIPSGATSAYDPMSMDWFAETHGQAARTTSRTSALANQADLGLLDPTPDNFGWLVSVPALLNNSGNTLNTLTSGAPLIAPFFGDCQLSQWSKETENPRDFGKVMYKRAVTGDSLIIQFTNISIKGILAFWPGYYQNTNIAADLEPTEAGHCFATAQVILVSRDSSIIFVYNRFTGRIAAGSFEATPANQVFMFNSTAGIRGYARHQNYNSKNPNSAVVPWGGEYQQYTHYFSKYRPNPPVDIPYTGSTVRFRQWKNAIRVVAIKYLVRKKVSTATTFEPVDVDELNATQITDYEFLAGHPQLGAVQPVAVFQNLTNDIQGPRGVNYQPQQLQFKARFTITNDATNELVYNKLINIDSACLAADTDQKYILCANNAFVRVNHVNVTNFVSYTTSTAGLTPWPIPDPNYAGSYLYNGIPPYQYAEIKFPPWEMNEFFQNQIGRMTAKVIAEPIDPRFNYDFGDCWPFDDTTSARFFVMRRWEQNFGDFKDDVSEFHTVPTVTGVVPIPSILKWVTIGANVVSGITSTVTPIPPLQVAMNANSKQRGETPIEAPVILFNRISDAGSDYQPPTVYNGDEIRSYPIDLRNRKGVSLSFSMARSTKQIDWPRGWCDDLLVGPELRSTVNNLWNTLATNTQLASANPDMLSVEFAQPSVDKINRIANLSVQEWRTLINPAGGTFYPGTDATMKLPYAGRPAFTLYGGGGYVRGFNSERGNYNDVLGNPTGLDKAALHDNVWDDGIDFEFNKFIVPIPDQYINAPNEGALNFRMRFKLYATDDQKCQTCMGDDKDPFYLDNVRLLIPSGENVDLEMSAVKLRWPYKVVPASQATQIPIFVKVSNNTSAISPVCWVQVRIFNTDKTGIPVPKDEKPAYCRTLQLPFFLPGEVKTVDMPSWNSRSTQPGNYRLIANVFIPAVINDLEPLNDTTFTDFKLSFGPVYSYIPSEAPDNPDDIDEYNNGQNDVYDVTAVQIGRGINLTGYSNGTGGGAGFWADEPFAAGDKGGSGSGSYASKFEVFNRDTLFGFQACFGYLNQSPDYMSFQLFNGNASSPVPTDPVPNTEIVTRRGLNADGSVFTVEQWINEEYATYTLPEPIILNAGVYWVVISQLGETGLELAGSAERMGMRITSLGVPTQQTPVTLGTGGSQLMIDKDLRPANRIGNVDLFAYENTRGSNNWVPAMRSANNPAYGHNNYLGQNVQEGGGTWTLSRGTWIPLIRPYFGFRTYSDSIPELDCEPWVPVELTSFEGAVRGNSIDLYWETASELDNQGFNVQRRTELANDLAWDEIGFVKGAGNSDVAKKYLFRDNDVVNGTTYQYKLSQVDIDGTVNCNESNIVEITYNKIGSVAIDEVYPNPFAITTKIKYSIPQSAFVIVEIVDAYGNVVKSLVNETQDAGNRFAEWDGTNQDGIQLPSGRYIYRLSAGNEVKTGNLTLMR